MQLFNSVLFHFNSQPKLTIKAHTLRLLMRFWVKPKKKEKKKEKHFVVIGTKYVNPVIEAMTKHK